MKIRLFIPANRFVCAVCAALMLCSCAYENNNKVEQTDLIVETAASGSAAVSDTDGIFETENETENETEESARTETETLQTVFEEDTEGDYIPLSEADIPDLHYEDSDTVGFAEKCAQNVIFVSREGIGGAKYELVGQGVFRDTQKDPDLVYALFARIRVSFEGQNGIITETLPAFSESVSSSGSSDGSGIGIYEFDMGGSEKYLTLHEIYTETMCHNVAMFNYPSSDGSGSEASFYMIVDDDPEVRDNDCELSFFFNPVYGAAKDTAASLKLSDHFEITESGELIDRGSGITYYIDTFNRTITAKRIALSNNDRRYDCSMLEYSMSDEELAAVESLRLSVNIGYESDMSVLKKLTGLRELEVSAYVHSDGSDFSPDMTSLGFLSGFTGLEKLCIEITSEEKESFSIDTLKNFKNLGQLCIYGYDQIDLNGIGELENLESLVISNIRKGVSVYGAESIAELERLSFLELADVRDADGRACGNIDFITQLPSLKGLSLCFMNGLSDLSDVRKMNLEELTVFECENIERQLRSFTRLQVNGILKKKMMSEEDPDNIFFFDWDDYDLDGDYEAFGFVVSKMEDRLTGRIKFRRIYSKAEYVGGESSENFGDIFTFYTSDGKKYICFDGAERGGTVIYGVNDNLPAEASISRKGSAFEIESSSDGGADTYLLYSFEHDDITIKGEYARKKYYFFYNNGFMEYGGIELTPEELKNFSGGEAMLDNAAAEGGTVTGIIRRSNGLIHINYTVPEGDSEYNYYKTYKVNTNGAELCDEGNGVYLTALMPEIAYYGDK